ncbi:MAG: hypothetical protein NTY90_05355 [Candidatus Micrarchaeota archaeon]|nr:hypothetical protein [Candidatus Micrarchaeota archaeon]
MVDVRKIIQDMVRSGMSEEQVIATLKELGVPDAEAVFREATEKLKEMEIAPEGAQGAAEAAEAPAGGEEKAGAEEKLVPDLEKIMKEASASPTPEEARELREKLDEITALLKALQDTVKQVLETDRNVLLRLKKE